MTPGILADMQGLKSSVSQLQSAMKRLNNITGQNARPLHKMVAKVPVIKQSKSNLFDKLLPQAIKGVTSAFGISQGQYMADIATAITKANRRNL